MESRTTKSAVGVRFAVTAVLLSFVLLAVMRLPWVERAVLTPFTEGQHAVACRIGGDPNARVVINLSCSGADVIALCLAFILAFPVRWRSRLVGAAVGMLLITAVNVLRIATLTRVDDNPELFRLLHVYLWPGALLVVLAVYVFAWMDAAQRGGGAWRRLGTGGWLRSSPARRFVALTVLFVGLFVAASGWLMGSPAIERVATWVTATAAGALQLAGLEAAAQGNVLRAPAGSFLVTQECVLTPLMPVYFAVVLALPLAGRRRLALLAGAAPLFFVLASVRLLVIALPLKLVGSHQVAVHGFYQVVLALFLIGAVALRYRGEPDGASGASRRPGSAGAGGHAWGRAAGRVAAGLGAAIVVALIGGRVWTGLVVGLAERLQELAGHGGHLYPDDQGALLLLPIFQLALFAALVVAAAPRLVADRWAAGGRLAAALGLLAVTQPLVVAAAGELATHLVSPPVAGLRLWALLAPGLAVWWAAAGRSRHRRVAPLPVTSPSHG